MANEEFLSDNRITLVSDGTLAGKTIAPESLLRGKLVFLKFTDGSFVYGLNPDWGIGDIDYSVKLDLLDAARLGLLAESEFQERTGASLESATNQRAAKNAELARERRRGLERGNDY